MPGGTGAVVRQEGFLLKRSTGSAMGLKKKWKRRWFRLPQLCWNSVSEVDPWGAPVRSVVHVFGRRRQVGVRSGRLL